MSIQTLDFEVGCILPQGDEVVIYVLWWQFSFATRYSSHRLSGVLFLDELPEFSKLVTETLRQPLEDGKITIDRAAGKYTYPSSFMLVCAMNPCRCGYFGSSVRQCTCKKEDIKQYLSKISGPLLDRIDIQVELPALEFNELSTPANAEPSSEIRRRVIEAREFAKSRFASSGMKNAPDCNAGMTSVQIRKACELDSESTRLLKAAFDRMGMSARGYDRVLRVARTIADLDRSEKLLSRHVAEAVQMRSLDRKYW